MLISSRPTPALTDLVYEAMVAHHPELEEHVITEITFSPPNIFVTVLLEAGPLVVIFTDI